MQKPSSIDIDPVIYLAIELSASTWLVVSKIPTSEKTGLHRMEAGDSQALLALIADLRKKVAAKLGVEASVMSCFEAGRDGFWLHRLLSENGVINHVVEPTSILVNRRARRAKPIGSTHRGYYASWPPTPRATMTFAASSVSRPSKKRMPNASIVSENISSRKGFASRTGLPPC